MKYCQPEHKVSWCALRVYLDLRAVLLDQRVKAQGMLMRHVGDASKLRVTTMDRENHEASAKPNKSRNPNPTKGGKLGRAIAPIVRA